jgi:hypothetical protein
VFFEVHGNTTSTRFECDDFIIGDIFESDDFRDTITEIDDFSGIDSRWREISSIDFSFERLDEVRCELYRRLRHKKRY